MLTVSVFSFWIAALFLLISGMGRSVLDRHHLTVGLAAALMAGVALAALISNIVNPEAVNAGDGLWSVGVGVLWVVYGKRRQWIWLANLTVMLALARLIGPLNPDRVQLVPWLPWEAAIMGVLAGVTGEDPLVAVLLAAGSELGSALLLSAYTGQLHAGTVRDLVFSLAAALVAWHSGWVASWWKRRRHLPVAKDRST